MAKVPVTYFPCATQRLFARNQARIRDKPYAEFFHEELYLNDSVLPALRAPMPVEHALPLGPEGFNRLLEPGYLADESGYCQLPDGSGYTASLVPFPGCTGEMLSWWFWWHAVEPERYTLWYPYNHIRAVTDAPEKLTAPGLSHTERYIGTTHRVLEYIGPRKLEVLIEFVDPAELGMDTSRFAAAGITAHACARVHVPAPRTQIVTMLHLARATDDGFELRSRYWIGTEIRAQLGPLALPLHGLFGATGLLSLLTGENVAYEQLLHDQIEFTNLASILAPLHRTFAE